MRKTRIWIFVLTLALVLGLSSGALAATPKLSGSAKVEGVVGNFGKTSITLKISGADSNNYPEVDLVIHHAGTDSTMTVAASVTPSANGSFSVTLPAKVLNQLPVGKSTIYASSEGNADNDPIDAVKVGTVTANKVPYTIYITATEGGSGYSMPTTATQGEEIFINAKAEAGYYFVNWTIVSGGVSLRDKGIPNLTFNMPANDVKLQANFRSNTGSSSSSSGSSSNNSSSSSTSGSSQTWTSNQLATLPTYTPVLAGARTTPVTGTITATTTQIYTAPVATAGTTAVGQMNQNDAITVLGYANDFFAVLVGSQTMGYVHGDDVNVTIDPAISGTLLQPATTIGDAAQLAAGTVLQITGREGANWVVTSNGQSYQIPAKAADGSLVLAPSAVDLTSIAASYTFPANGNVRDGGVNVRASASTSAQQLGTFNGGASFLATGYESNFFIVQRDSGEIGYVAAEFTDITLSPPIYGTVLQTVSAYSRPSAINSNFAATLATGTVVALQGREGGWWVANAAGQTLYVKAEYINVPTIK